MCVSTTCSTAIDWSDNNWVPGGYYDMQIIENGSIFHNEEWSYTGGIYEGIEGCCPIT